MAKWPLARDRSWQPSISQWKTRGDPPPEEWVTYPEAIEIIRAWYKLAGKAKSQYRLVGCIENCLTGE